MAITYPACGGTPAHVEYEGAVLDMGEMNYHDDSDFYAVVWDGEMVKRVEYNTTRFAGGGYCVVDATPEVQEEARAWLRERLFQMWKEADKADARRPLVGRRVRIVKGRPTQKMPDGSRQKVLLGTEGVVFHREEQRSRYGTWIRGYRLGIALSDRRAPGYTLTEDGESLVLKAPYRVGFPDEARALGGDWDRGRRVWTFPANRKAEVKALADKHFPGKHLDVVWTSEANVEVVDPEQYEHPEEVGRKWAAAHDQSWRAYTHPRGSRLMFVA